MGIRFRVTEQAEEEAAFDRHEAWNDDDVDALMSSPAAETDAGDEQPPALQSDGSTVHLVGLPAASHSSSAQFLCGMQTHNVLSVKF